MVTEASGYFVRQAPGGDEQILGKLHYTEYDVTVLEGRVIPKDGGPEIEDLWYRVRFAPEDFERVVVEYEVVLSRDQFDPGGLEAIDNHAAAIAAHQGTEGWIGQAALSVVAMPWSHFLLLLDDFEHQYASEDVGTRLSRLRQMGENPDVAGNDAAGSGADVPNQISIWDRHPDPAFWSILLEAKQVEFPDGEVLDIHHFLLGVESLIDDGRRDDDRTVVGSFAGIGLVDLRIGESFSALTWSGDVGGAVGDMVCHLSPDWEAAAPRTRQETVAFYLRTRAPSFDLLADVDAWGAYTLMPRADGAAQSDPPVTTLVELVTTVYGPADVATPEHQASRDGFRARGVRRMLLHYGFAHPTGLLMQVEPVERMEEQLEIFSNTWFLMKELKALSLEDPWPWPDDAETAELKKVTLEMSPPFLEWLDDLAEALVVTL